MGRAIRIASPLVALAILGVILYNATLVDRVPPAVQSVYLGLSVPGNDRLGQTLTTIDIRFTKPVRTGTVERRFSITPAVAGTWSWEGQRVAIFTPSHKLPAATKFSVTLQPGFEDLVGNVAGSGIQAWTFSTVGPPAIVTISPRNGSQEVPVDTAIRITFDRLMDTPSVTAAVSLSPAVGYAVAWSGPTLTLTPSQPLAFDTTYTLTIGADAADTDGTHLPETSISFTTVPTGLVALSVVPAPNVSGISVRSPIAVFFDGAIDPASIAGALDFTPPVAGAVRVATLPDDSSPQNASATPAAAAAGRILLFEPSQPLAAHTTYTVTLRPVVHRPGQPNQVGAGESWTFTTGQASQSAQNQVAFISGRSGVPNVWLMNADGTNARQLTSELVPVTGFDFSPDGGSVAYAAGGVVKRMRMDGSDLTVMTSGGRFEYDPVYTPDGNGLIVARRAADGSDQGYWEVPLLAGGAERQVVPDGAPPLGSVNLGGDGLVPSPGLPAWADRSAFSSDGRYLLLVGGDGTVRLVDLGQSGADTPPTPVVTTLPLVADGSPTWSVHDAAFEVVAQAEGSSSSAVYAIRPGSVPQRGIQAVGQVAVSGDGHLAILQATTSGAAQLAYASGNGATVVLAASPDFDARSPAFAPDGSAILFARVLAGARTTSAGIWLVNPDGSGLRQLAPDGAYPLWLP